MSLREIIQEKISKDGPISFHDFMEISLYYPEIGYYSSARDKIGWNGDYYTSPHLTCLFGEMIAKQLEEMWRIQGSEKFSIVEYGAGTGVLCHNILARLKLNKKLYNQLNYCIIEKSDTMCRKEKKILNEKVSWHNSIQELAPVTGCILSNEVVDNFSVHQVVMTDELMEVFVDFKNDFFELLMPASEILKNYLREFKIRLDDNFHTEINLQAIDWIKEIGKALQKGFVLTIDYGFPSFELYNHQRRNGTLLCYYRHRINDCPYINIGEQDITTHVNFSALNHWGLKNGLQCTGFTNQACFLLALGFTEHLRRLEQKEKQAGTTVANVALLNSLLLDMGTKHKVFIQHKNLSKPQLTGLKFSSQVKL